MIRDATISECGLYRYELLRRWGEGAEYVTWIMLNPSTADAEVDDPTIRRCVGFTRRLGYDALSVVNLFAFRATSPKKLLQAAHPVGPLNRAYVTASCRGAALIVAAWGAWKQLPDFMASVFDEGLRLRCLGMTLSGCPRHPLYLKADAPLVDWVPPRR